MVGSIRIHTVNLSAQHWAIEKEGCPSCGVHRGAYCNDTSTRYADKLPANTVHVARVRANGYNAI